MSCNRVSKHFLFFLFLLSVTTIYSQSTINIISTGDAGPTSGTNWSISGTTLTATGAANIQASVIETALSSGNLTVASGTGSDFIIQVNEAIDYTGATERTLTFGATHRVLVYQNISSTSAPLNIILASEFDRASGFTGGGYGVGVFTTITTNGGDVWIGGGQLTGSWNGHTVGVGAAMGGGGANGVGAEISNATIGTNGGDVRILGTSSGSPGINAYWGNSTINAGAGNIELISDRMGFDFGGSWGDIQIDGTGYLALAPLESSFANAVTWDGTLSNGYYTSTGGANTIDGLKIKNTMGLIIGKPGNSAPLTIASDIAINGPISFESGSFTINSSVDLQTTAAGSDILVKANDYTPGPNATDGYISFQGDNITTNGGDIILWANASNRSSGSANNEIWLQGSSTLTSNGGKIVLAGGSDDGSNGGTASDGIPDGYAYRSGYGNSAIIINENVSLLSGGGDVIIHGHSGLAGDSGTPRSFGVWADAGFKLDAGTGTINIRGKSESESAIWLGATSSGTLSPIAITSASTTATAITIHGESTSTTSTTGGHGFIANWDGSTESHILIESSGASGGGVSITGITNIANDGIILGQTGTSESIQILSQAGDVSLISNAGMYIGNDAFIGNRKDANAVNGITPSVQSSSADILIRANSFNGTGANFDVSTTGSFTIEPYDNAFTSAFTYPITGLTLSSNASGLTLGKSSNTADVTVAGATSIAGPITIYGGGLSINASLIATSSNINLHASVTVTQTASIIADGLGLHGSGTFTLQNSSNNVATIAGGTSSSRLGNITYRDADDLEIGSVNPDGVFSSGTVLIETENGDLTLSENINTTSTSNDAIILNAGRSSSSGTASGGDIIVSGSPTLTFGSGGRAKLFSGTESQSTNLISFVGKENTRRGFDEVSQPNDLEDDKTYAIYRFGNLAPIVTSSSVTSATAESLYSYDIQSSDPENDFISWSVTTIPDWLTFSSDAIQTNFLGTGIRPTNTRDGTNQSSDTTNASSAVISAGTAAHSDNKLFFTDKEEYGIRYVDSNGQLQTWYQGDGNWRSLNPVGIAYDVTNNAVYVGDYSTSDILKIDNNGSKTLLSDLPERFMFRLLLNSSDSKLYVSARGGIYEIDLTNNNPSTNYKRVVGTGRFGYSDTGLASTSQVFFPHGMAFDSSGRLVFTDRHNDIIRRVDLSQDTIETIAGKQGQGVEAGDGGLAINATFADPSGLIINGKDEIFISERLSKRIRKIDANGSIDTFFRVSSGGFADDLVISATGELYLLTSNLVAQVATLAKLTGTPTNDDAGTHDVKLILNDGVNYTPYNFQITVAGKLIGTTIGATVEVTDSLTSEEGDTGSFTVVLDSQPGHNVTIDLSSNDTGEGSIGVSSVTFTPSNWNIPQTITVTGVDDSLADGSKGYQIVTGNVTSSDTDYNSLDGTTINDANMTNEDNDPDTDGDGRENNADAFPLDPSEDTDTDGDGTGDNKDIFPNDPDSNGDTDGDGVSDPFDLCPNTASGSVVDANGCAAYQRDTDGDGVTDDKDNCVTTANADQKDTDGDGVGDVCDNCINFSNNNQLDTDRDGIGNTCDDDDDNDGTPDTSDDFPEDPNEDTDTDDDGIGNNEDPDDDNDGVLDTEDNCPLGANPDQKDTDGDDIGDACDLDDDNDGQTDQDEIDCGSDSLDAASVSIDIDLDGIPDCKDTDRDGDGVENDKDVFPDDSQEWLDNDQDGIGNNADPDDDNDGQTDQDEIDCGSDPLDPNSISIDIDQDGIPDCKDTDRDGDGVENNKDVFPDNPQEWSDNDQDGTGDNADPDDDNDGHLDVDEIACGTDPLDRRSRPSDIDKDSIPDCVDDDIDNDGCLNEEDKFPTDPNQCLDTDNDGIGDVFDWDDDGDGIPDYRDDFPLDPTRSKDTDGDGIDDANDPDYNGDGLADDELFPAQVFSPNGDGINDTWKIVNTDLFPNCEVWIYTRSGELVYNKREYRNDWQGLFQGVPLPESSYIYLIDKEGDGVVDLRGWVYLTR